MTAREFTEVLAELTSDNFDGNDGEQHASCATFEDCGMMTRDEGFVVTLSNGDEFQVTVVQSRISETDEDDDDA